MSFFTLWVLLVLSPFAGQDQSYGSISGVTTDFETKRPIPDVSITLMPTPLKTRTGSDGRFLFLRVPTGAWEMEVSHPDYPTIRYKGIRVVEDSTVALHIPLPKFPRHNKMPTFVPDSSVEYKMRFYNPEEREKVMGRDSSKEGGKRR